MQISVENKRQRLEYGVDESYVLDIPVNGGKATLKCKTMWGALRGLETFSQLVQARLEQDEDGEIIYYEDADDIDTYEGFGDLFIPNVPIIIKDSPKYSHRGLMLGKT